jgi:hypothetical protein
MKKMTTRIHRRNLLKIKHNVPVLSLDWQSPYIYTFM